MGGQHAPLKFDSLPRKKLSFPPKEVEPLATIIFQGRTGVFLRGVFYLVFFVYINWLEPSRTNVANGSKIRYCEFMCFESWNEPFGQSGCDIFLVEVFDEDFIDIARSHTFPPQRSEAGQLARTWLGFGILEIDAWKGCQERVADLKKRDPKQYGRKALEHSTATGSAQGRGKSSNIIKQTRLWHGHFDPWESGRRRQSEFQVLKIEQRVPFANRRRPHVWNKQERRFGATRGSPAGSKGLWKASAWAFGIPTRFFSKKWQNVGKWKTISHLKSVTGTMGFFFGKFQLQIIQHIQCLFFVWKLLESCTKY